jgi:hypothetical protein
MGANCGGAPIAAPPALDWEFVLKNAGFDSTLSVRRPQGVHTA